MATTWIKPIHKTKRRSVAATLADRIGYADNPDKNNNHEYVKSYCCDYYTAANEFALSKEIYGQQTGRKGRKGDILAYHVRQSFAPGEITPEMALEVGCVLMEKFTRNRHQYVVAVHTDKNHIHCHCIFNAVNMDCSGKFRNPMRSMRIVRRISDLLCAERGLSIVENPKPSRGSYRDWQDRKEPQSNRDKLQDLIDGNISTGMAFEQFIAAMTAAGCGVKRGKYLSFKLPGAERFIRVKSLGDGYTEESLRERCAGKRAAQKRNDTGADAERKTAEHAASRNRPKLLIDIEEKLRQGYGAGFEHYATIQNLKEAAKTLVFLKENGIGTYGELVKKASETSGGYSRMNERRKEIDSRLSAISELQKHVGQYGKTRGLWAAYKRSGWDSAFFEANRAPLMRHKAAKKFFDGQGFKEKLPSINSLKQEYAVLLSEKKSLGNIKAAREEMIDWTRAKHNVDSILGERPEQQKSRDRKAR